MLVRAQEPVQSGFDDVALGFDDDGRHIHDYAPMAAEVDACETLDKDFENAEEHVLDVGVEENGVASHLVPDYVEEDHRAEEDDTLEAVEVHELASFEVPSAVDIQDVAHEVVRASVVDHKEIHVAEDMGHVEVGMKAHAKEGNSARGVEEDMEEPRVKVHMANLEGAGNWAPQLARMAAVDVQMEEEDLAVH
jgi:hypothetical protein